MVCYMVQFFECGYGCYSSTVIFANKDDAQRYVDEENKSNEYDEGGDRYFVQEVKLR